MVSIRQRLLRVEDDFLLAITDGSVEFFDDQWTALARDVEEAVQSSSLDDETVSLAYTTSCRIAVLADVFRDLNVFNEKLTSHVISEVEGIFSQLTVDDLQAHSLPSRETSPSLSLKSGEERIARLSANYGSSSRRVLDSYHDSSLSPTPSLVSLSTTEDSDDDIMIMPVIGRKRLASSLEDAETANPFSDRIIKRARMSHALSYGSKDCPPTPSYGSKDGSPTPSPSIPVSIHDNNTVSLLTHKASEPQDGCLLGSPSRKRRLSDEGADLQRDPKRSRGLPVGPRLHAVSDPFPIGSALVEAQVLDDWWDAVFGTTEAPSLSWEEVESPVPVKVNFFDSWTSMSAGSCFAEMTEATTAITSPVNSGLQPIMTVSSSDIQCGVLPESIAELTPADSVTVSSPSSDLFELFELPEGRIYAQSSLLAPSRDDVINMLTPGVIPPSAVLELSPLSYQCGLPNIAAESNEPDVMSLYTTLYDTDPTLGLADCGNLASDLSAGSSPAESAGEEDWTRTISPSEQPLEVIFPVALHPYGRSTDMSCLLESLAQPIGITSVPTPDYTLVVSDMPTKLKELEAAKETVRRLEAEVGMTS